MSIRRYEVEVTSTLFIEIDDEVTSEHYAGETVLTAHANRDRFVEGSTVETAIGNVAIRVGIERRQLSHVDGWADFPDAAAQSLGWPDYRIESVSEVPRQ